MKRLTLLIISLVLILGCFGQVNEVRANRIIADDKIFPPVKDTTTAPQRVGQLTVRAQDTSLYMAISMTAPKKWQKILKLTDFSNVTQTLQQTFNTEIGGSLLTKQDTIITATGNGIRVIGNSAVFPVFNVSNTGNASTITATNSADGGAALSAQVHGSGTSGTNTGASVSAVRSGSGTNIGLFASASAATNNYAIVANGGKVVIGDNTGTSTSSLFEVFSTTQGVTIPRLTTTQMNAISSPSSGLLIWNTDSLEVCKYNGSIWLKVGGGGGAGVTDHGALTGLTDDDHAQYALLAGRSTGQLLKGGTGSAENLELESTNHSTKGRILIKDSANFNGKTIENFSAKYNNQTGTTYTLNAADNGKIVTFNNGSDITLTVPAGLPAGFTCTIVQLGAGEVVFTASSTTLNNRQAFTKTAGQYAVAAITMYASDTFIFGGDCQ